MLSNDISEQSGHSILIVLLAVIIVLLLLLLLFVVCCCCLLICNCRVATRKDTCEDTYDIVLKLHVELVL